MKKNIIFLIPLIVSFGVVVEIGEHLHQHWIIPAYGLIAGVVLYLRLIIIVVQKWILRRKDSVWHELLTALRIAALVTILLSLFAATYSFFGLKEGAAIVKHNFADAMYFSAVTFTTVGYGDIVPAGYMRLVASIEAFTGYFTLAIVTAGIIARLLKPKE